MIIGRLNNPVNHGSDNELRINHPLTVKKRINILYDKKELLTSQEWKI